MAKTEVEALVEGGKASAGPPLGPALGPLGVNIGQVISEINKKTADFKGMQVPVKVMVETDTKEFSISIGTPPASSLILKEAGLTQGSGHPSTEFVADLRIENIIKVAKMKQDSLLGKGDKERVKEIIGTCQSMGIMVEGVKAQEILAMIDQGKFDSQIASGKTELSAEEIKEMEEEKRKMAEDLKEKHAELEEEAKKILSGMTGKTRGEMKAKLTEAKIPPEIFEPLLPKEEEKGEAPASGNE